MNFQFFFETKEHFLLKVYANKKVCRWESGGAFGSDWSKKQWYEGIVIISKEGTKWHFSFQTHKVRDTAIPELNHCMLFGEMSVREILDRCEKLSKTLENQPFPFVEIGADFIPASIEISNAETRIEKGEDG